MLRAASGLAFLLGVLGAALFAPAWTLDYWQAWAFLAVFGSVVLAITIYLAIVDPALLARRTKAGVLAEPTAAPLALASWWAFTGVAALAAVIVIRLLDEEKLLATSLAGYADYRQRVRRRLVPFVW